MRKPATDIVIVGGGLIGLAAAYFLAGRGARVLLLEKDSTAAGASSGAAGMLGVDSEAEEDPVRRRFAAESRRLYESLAPSFYQETGVDIEFEGKGLLTLAQNVQEEDALRTKAADGHGDYLEPGAVARSCPELAGSCAGGLFHPSDGQVTASRVAEAFRRSAEIRGVVVRERGRVSGLLRKKGKVMGVRVGGESIPAGVTILALGARGWSLTEPLGWRPPIFPVRGELLLFRPSQRLLPFPVFLGESGFYLVPKPDGTFLAGTTVKRTARSSLTREGQEAISRAALASLPSLGDAPFLGGWAGLRPGTPDGWPLLGPVPGWEGLWVASGHFRRGVLLAPVTGLWLAEAVTGTPRPDMKRFAPDRFEMTRNGSGQKPSPMGSLPGTRAARGRSLCQDGLHFEASRPSRPARDPIGDF